MAVTSAIADDRYERLMVFGDSLSDVGNDFYITMGAIPPETRYSGGRFSNGWIWLDYLADRYPFQLPLLPSEMGVDLFAESSLVFACGGSGTGTVNLVPGGFFEVPGVLGQIDQFAAALEFSGLPADSLALYSVWGGANDYFFGESSTGDGTVVLNGLNNDPQQVVANLGDALYGLYELGARRFLVPNLPDLGKTPFGSRNADDLDARTGRHNHLLALALLELSASLPDAQWFFVDVNGLYRAILADPEDFGFPADFSAGPATGCLFPPFDCGPIEFETNPVSWDEQHPSTKMHEHIAALVLERLSRATVFPSVDVKPDTMLNEANLAAQGVLPVAILTTSLAQGEASDFDALQVDSSTVRFGPAGIDVAHPAAHIEDVDGDGDMDLLLHFSVREAAIACGDAQAVVTGVTLSGQSLIGSDSIVTICP